MQLLFDTSLKSFIWLFANKWEMLARVTYVTTLFKLWSINAAGNLKLADD